jgi:hypothetical protein
VNPLFDSFTKVTKGELPEDAFLEPLLVWMSGYEGNIESFQRVNERFKYMNNSVLIKSVALNNTLKHIIRSPRAKKLDDEKTDFFYNDICSYYGWSRLELEKNLQVLDFDFLKKEIAKLFGYDKKQQRLLSKCISANSTSAGTD